MTKYRTVMADAASEYAGQIGEVLQVGRRPGLCYLLRFADGRELWFRGRETGHEEVAISDYSAWGAKR